MSQPQNNQTAFWEAMKEKYERRNENLRQQEICLRQRLEQLKQLMEKQQTGDDCDCVPEKLEKTSLVQCLVEKGKNLILGSCKCGDPNVGEDFLCACHITNPNTPLNVDQECPLKDTPKPSDPEGCLNTTCDFYNPQLASLGEDPSTFSLRTTDIYYMDKLAELVKAEKFMQEKIEDLEQREHSYITAIQDLQEAIKKKPKDDPMRKEFSRIAEGMEDENKKLKNELEDLRLELKHCFERVEGPLRRSLEEQKEKCTKMEKELKDLQTQMATKEDGYLKEINEIKAKLCHACCTMVDLNSVNSKLKDDLNFLQNKCADLEDELIKQQLREAENILKFKNALSRRSPQADNHNRGDDSEQELGNIARKLSATLKEVCPCVTNVPSGLTETVQNIKQLTDFVGEKGTQQRKKRTGTLQKSSSCSCTFDSECEKEKAAPKPQSDDKKCGCSTSSLRLQPTVTSNYLVTTENMKSRRAAKPCGCSTSLICAPNAGAKMFRQATPPQTPVKEDVEDVSSTVMKKTTKVSKSCTCCPVQVVSSPKKKQAPTTMVESKDTICSCTDFQTKRTGPSEEIIAVKHLGNLSFPPGELVVQAVKTIGGLTSEPPKPKKKREKLAVDTTCDVLDIPPEDIHVITTIAKTGSLEITTEGPPGVIETKVNYLPDGRIEIVTKLIDHNKMASFLDGTLLHIPEGQPDTQCNESQTCEGQCNSVFGLPPKTTCPDLECFETKNCDGQCSEENEIIAKVKNQETKELKISKKSSSTPYGQFIVNNNYILINGKGTNPFVPGEWKNQHFSDNNMEEFQFSNMLSNKKPIRRNEDKIDQEIVDSNEDLSKGLKLSSRPSLTDVEKYSPVDNEEGSVHSSASFIYNDVLETISECDEEEDSKGSHSGQNIDQREQAKTEDTKKEVGEDKIILESCFMKNAPLTDTPIQDYSSKIEVEQKEDLTTVDTEDDDTSKTSQEFEEQTEDETPTPSSSETKESGLHILKICSKEGMKDMSSAETVINFSLQNNSSTELGVELRSSILLQENRSQVRSESFCKLYRNFGNINLLRGSFQLKQSKSMYEKKDNGTECLRVCKSAVFSLGSLKIDLDKIKFMYGVSSVGDFNEKKIETKKKSALEDTLCPVSTAEYNSELSYMQTVEGILSEISTDGEEAKLLLGTSRLESTQIVPDQTYQCYVCSCSNKKDKKDASEGTNPRHNVNLEQRIDRLLEINPITTSHGPNCHCVDCLVHNAQRNIPRVEQSPRTCRCSKKLQDIANKVDPALHRCKCNTKDNRLAVTEEIRPKVVKPLYESPKHQGDSTQHGKNCTCVDCICNPCNFKKNSGATCDCAECKCGTCCDSTKNPLASMALFSFEQQPEITVMSLRMPCDCGGKCPCSPCADGSKKPKPPSKSQLPPQSKSSQQTTACKRCQSRVQGGQSAETPPRSKRADIACGSSPVMPKESSQEAPLRSPDTWKTVIGNPCGPPPNDKKEVCDCKVCECKPCGYAEKARKPCDCKPPKKEKPVGPKGKCICNPCKCEICGDSEIGKNILKQTIRDVILEQDWSTVNPNVEKACDCKPCECVFCSDPKVRKYSDTDVPPADMRKIPPVSEKSIQQSEVPKCLCSKCKCNPCKNLPLNIGDASSGGKCDCAKCECDPCFVGTSIGKNIAMESASSREMELKVVSCDCTQCTCEETCMGNVDAQIRGDDDLKEEPSKPLIVLSQAQGDQNEPCCPCSTNRGTNEPPGECSECLECLEKRKNEEKRLPCDCEPCPCEPCPDPNVKPPIIGDADRAKEEIMNVLNKIGCTCDRAEDNLKPLVKQASNFESTVSNMKLKLNNLQQKCKDKDQIISAMTKELRIRSESGVFADLLKEMAHPKAECLPDFNRTYVCDYLPTPKQMGNAKLHHKKSLGRFDNRLEPILELDRYLPGTNDDARLCTKCRNNPDVSAMEIIDIRRVTIDSILIKWRSPSNLSDIIGYQIFVNEELKYKVLSPNRTNAVLDSLDLNSSLEIMLFAMAISGRCEPPALATYKI